MQQHAVDRAFLAQAIGERLRGGEIGRERRDDAFALRIRQFQPCGDVFANLRIARQGGGEATDRVGAEARQCLAARDVGQRLDALGGDFGQDRSEDSALDHQP